MYSRKASPGQRHVVVDPRLQREEGVEPLGVPRAVDEAHQLGEAHRRALHHEGALQEPPRRVAERRRHRPDVEALVGRPGRQDGLVAEADGRRERGQRRDVLGPHRGVDRRHRAAHAVAQHVRLTAGRRPRGVADRAAEVAVAHLVEGEVAVLVGGRAPAIM
jgi:hypothetical protein